MDETVKGVIDLFTELCGAVWLVYWQYDMHHCYCIVELLDVSMQQ